MPITWEISSRENVPFHEGHLMDAEDVAFTISAECLREPEPMPPRRTRYAANIVRVEATGPLTVEVEPDIADPSFSNRLATPLGFVLRKHHHDEVVTDAFGKQSMATGPYGPVSFDPSTELMAGAFDDQSNSPAPAASLTFRSGPKFLT